MPPGASTSRTLRRNPTGSSTCSSTWCIATTSNDPLRSDSTGPQCTWTPIRSRTLRHTAGERSHPVTSNPAARACAGRTAGSSGRTGGSARPGSTAPRRRSRAPSLPRTLPRSEPLRIPPGRSPGSRPSRTRRSAEGRSGGARSGSPRTGGTGGPALGPLPGYRSSPRPHARGALGRAAEPPVDRSHLSANHVPRIVANHPRPPAPAHRPEDFRRLRQRHLQRGHERIHADLHPPARAFLLEPAPGRPLTDDRGRARSEGLGYGHRKVVRIRRQHVQVGGAIQRELLLAVDRARELDPLEPEFARELPHLAEVAVVGTGDDQIPLPIFGLHDPPSLKEQVDPLFLVDAAEKEELTAALRRRRRFLVRRHIDSVRDHGDRLAKAEPLDLLVLALSGHVKTVRPLERLGLEKLPEEALANLVMVERPVGQGSARGDDEPHVSGLPRPAGIDVRHHPQAVAVNHLYPATSRLLDQPPRHGRRTPQSSRPPPQRKPLHVVRNRNPGNPIEHRQRRLYASRGQRLAQPRDGVAWARRLDADGGKGVEDHGPASTNGPPSVRLALLLSGRLCRWRTAVENARRIRATTNTTCRTPPT